MAAGKPFGLSGVSTGVITADIKATSVVSPSMFQANDGDLASLHHRYYAAMVRLASVYVDDIDSAEEVVQEAFLKMVKGRRRPKPGHEAAYLRSAVLNGARSVLRRRKVARLKMPRLRPVENNSHAPETLTMIHDDRDRLWDALLELPERQAAVLVLRYYENLSEAEIAEVLGIAKGSVKSHAHRALRKLETRMGQVR